MYDVLVDNVWSAGNIDYKARTTILPLERCSSEASSCQDQRLCSRASKMTLTLKLGTVSVWCFHWGLSARENSIAVLYHIFILICAGIFTCGWFSWVAEFGGESCEGTFKDFANVTLLCLSQAQSLDSYHYGPFDHWPIKRFSSQVINFAHPQFNHFFFRRHEDVFSDAQANRGWLCFGRFLDEKKSDIKMDSYLAKKSLFV